MIMQAFGELTDVDVEMKVSVKGVAVRSKDELLALEHVCFGG
jgi:hypothetical protein